MLTTLRNTLLALLVCASATIGAQNALSPDVGGLLTKAQAGDATAQFLLANAFDTGRGVSRDSKEAVRWYLAAAEQGHAEAQNSVGSGLQAEKRFAEALPWYQKASEQNHALATNNLAYLYDLGLGVPQDRQRAHTLYLRAADLGWAEAMWNLANMYGAGQLGGPPDLVTACTWTLRAQRYAEKNDPQLNVLIARVVPVLERKLPSEQMTSCREQAQAWSPTAAPTRADLPRPEK
jgi:TPR repeat protein